MAKYEAYFESVKRILGDHLSQEVEHVISNLISNIGRVGSHVFHQVPTMGFIGSSIVEGSNVLIKQGVLAAKASMNIDMAGNQMLQQVDKHNHNRNTILARSIVTYKHWSASETKETLTPYMEGLGVKNFDSRDNYYCIKDGEHSWLVVRKAAVDYLLPTDSELSNRQSVNVVPHYLHVRKVRVDGEGFMSCTCSYCYNYLAPCRHMMVVLKDTDNVRPDLFHIRWWEVFNYFYLTDFGIQAVPDVHRAIDELFSNINLTLFTSNMTFKGCSTRFLAVDALQEKHNKTNDGSLIAPLIKHMSCLIDLHGFIEEGNKKVTEYMTMLVHRNMNANTICDEKLAEFNNFICDESHLSPKKGFGGLSETVGLISPKCIMPTILPFNERACIQLKDTEEYHLFMSVKEAAKTKEQKIRLRQVLLELSHEFLSQNRAGEVLASETTFIGEDGSKGPRGGKRHKQAHERWKK